MFLQKVFSHSRWLFLCMIVFMLIQLFINFKRGVVVSPFYHYGMYSEVMRIDSQYSIKQVVVDDQVLKGEDFTPQEWDKILLPVRYFMQLDSISNNLYHTDIRRLMAAAHIATDEAKYVQNCDYPSFINWYKPYLQRVIGKEITKVSVKTQQYSFHHQLQPAGPATDLADLCR